MVLRVLLGVVGFLLIVGAVFLIAMGLFGGVEDDSSATPPQPTPATSSEIPSETDSQQQEQPRSDIAIVGLYGDRCSTQNRERRGSLRFESSGGDLVGGDIFFYDGR